VTGSGDCPSLGAAEVAGQKGRSEAIGMADLRTRSPPLATTLGDIIKTNNPEATASYGHIELVASFQFFGRAPRSR
jgi:hypothetical protein